jgi:hypothetical protein
MLYFPEDIGNCIDLLFASRQSGVEPAPVKGGLNRIAFLRELLETKGGRTGVEREVNQPKPVPRIPLRLDK